MTHRTSSRSFSWLAVLEIAIAVVLAIILPTLAGAQIVLSEIMADPASDWDGDGAYDFRDDEWVEVLNTSSVAVDLTAYWLRDEAADEPRLNLFGVLEPGAVAVFYGSQALAWQAETGTGSGALALNNGGDVVYLLRTGPGGYEDLEIVDSVAYVDHEAEDDRSSGLGTDQASWLLFDQLNPYAGTAEPLGTGCGPSPGVVNTCDPLPVERVRFGDVKACYR